MQTCSSSKAHVDVQIETSKSTVRNFIIWLFGPTDKLQYKIALLNINLVCKKQFN